MPDRHHNLPARRTKLIGRAADLQALLHAVLRSEGRLVTVIGAGGSGKTSLSIEAARLALPDFPDGTWLVDLASVDDPSFIAIAVCTALGLLDHGSSPDDALVEFLQPRSILIVLDNCEHLVAEIASLVDRLLDRCEDVRILATSRAPLHVRGESVFVVSPLTVPASGVGEVEVVAAFPSVELFVARARAHVPGFELDAESAPSVAAICRQLAGLPLAIELAAAQVAALTPFEIEEALRSRAGDWSQDAPLPSSRQRTMDAAIAWSHRLLSSREQAVFRRLAVFSGGWTLAAAEAVCAGGNETDVRATLAGLVQASLVSRETHGPTTRFYFLAPIAEWARRKLDRSDEADAVSEAHATYYLELATRRHPGPVHASPDDLQRIALEDENCVAALRWAERTGSVATAVGLARGLNEYWRVRGLLRLGLLHFDIVRSMIGAEPSRARTVLLLASANYRQLLGEHDAAATLAREVAEEARGLGDGVALRTALAILGDIAAARGDFVGARARYEQARPVLEARPDPLAVAFWQANVGGIALADGSLDEAELHLGKARELLAAHQPVWYVGRVLSQLGALALRRGRLAQADSLLGEAIATLRRYGARVEAIECFELLGRLALEQRDPARAATLFAAAAGLREATGLGIGPGPSGHMRPVVAEPVDRAREALSAVAFASAWSEGRAMSFDEAAAFGSFRPIARIAKGRQPSSELTPREQEVARLVGRGLRNSQIAAALAISPGTARIHVERILGKLGLTSRVQIATWVVREDRAEFGAAAGTDA